MTAPPTVVTWSNRDGLQPVSQQDRPLPLRAELAAIEASDHVVAGPPHVDRLHPPGTEGCYVVTFKVRWDRPAVVANHDILNPEPIALLYAMEHVGRDAPWAYSDRADFPRDLPHLNPVPDHLPAHFCLAREGSQALYDHRGAAGLVARLAGWLSDAAAGTLDQDGWEPYPRFGVFEASINGAWLQEQAFAHSPRLPGRLLGVASATFVTRDGHDVRAYVDIPPQAMSLGEIRRQLRQAVPQSRNSEERFPLPWVFAWGGRSSEPRNEYLSLEVEDLGGLYRLASYSGCDEGVRTFLDLALSNLAPPPVFICVIIGTWRPRPMIAEIPGLSQGPARTLELAAFLLKTEGSAGNRQIPSVRPLRLLAAANRELLARLSGDRAPEACAIVGCGALGSKIATYLVREGIERLALIDPDYLAPHNLARHVLDRNSLGFNKATELKRRFESTTDVVCRARRLAIHNLPRGKLDEEMGTHARVLVDATADRRALRRLCLSDVQVPVVRVELADGGRLGLLYAEGSNRNPRVDDLEVSLYRESVCNELVRAWLRREANPSPTVTGLGCASPTMVMPDSRVALHAASFMPTIDARLRHCVVDGGIGLNVLDLLGTPAGWHWVQVPPFVTLRTTGEGLPEDVWTVRMHPDAFATVKSAATANAPVECGGYLFGRYDLELLTISIAEAVQVTPIETAPSHILLPAAVESSAERDLLTACAGTLMIMGTWHSHPKGSATMSETDRTQCLKVARDNGLTPRPAVMLIISPEGQRAYVVYPDSWR